MKFFDYCATKYASINREIKEDDLKGEFSLKKQAQTKATHELIEYQRRWLRFCAKFYFLFDFVACHFTNRWPVLPEKPKSVEKPALVKDNNANGEKTVV